MEVTRILPKDSDYPAAVKAELAEPPALSAIGNRELLKCRLLAFFCSVKCPGNLILQTYDLARALRDACVPVIGGFHSPMEKECLALLLRGTQPVGQNRQHGGAQPHRVLSYTPGRRRAHRRLRSSAPA